MEIREVNSSAANAIGVDGSDLLIVYRNGRTYRYYGAGDNVNQLWNAERDGLSIGRLINSTIKGNYRYYEYPEPIA